MVYPLGGNGIPSLARLGEVPGMKQDRGSWLNKM